MKSWILLILGIHAVGCDAQQVIRFEKIGVSQYKTVSLVFPSNIINMDRGSEQVLVHKSTDNILKVKAAVDSFPEASLTVITADGSLYTFLVAYAEHPIKLSWYFGDTTTAKAVHPLAASCEKVLKLKSGSPAIKYSSGKVSLQWLGWFISGNKLFCKLKFSNRSNIGYDIEQFQLYIRDNLVSRRTASQELIQKPLYVAGETGTIKGGSSRVLIIAIDKFTIPDDKHFAIEVLEKNGGRHLNLRTYNRQLMHAKEF